MELGEKLRQARLEAGLSQRQLCGEEITRNMLSQIEHGTARPSMKTLQYLAGKLHKPVSYFLEEAAMVSPNQEAVTAARQHYDAGRFPEAAAALEDCLCPDPVYGREIRLLYVLTCLSMAEQAIESRREIYALELLEKAACPAAYCPEDLERRRLLLLGRIRGQRVSHLLPSLDGELLLRAEEALTAGDASRASRLLDAAEDQLSPRWNLLRGDAYLGAGQWQSAARCFHQAEAACPRETAPRLEQCYRELKNYRLAYEYACKQK